MKVNKYNKFCTTIAGCFALCIVSVHMHMLICMRVWVCGCVCMVCQSVSVRECKSCHVRHFVTYFLSFVSCVLASFSASLVSDSSSSFSFSHSLTSTHSLHVSSYTHPVCLCVCVCQKMLHCFWHARRHCGTHTYTYTYT